jgi:uncharacterized repeat protein (TIGR02543 family)
MKQKLLKTMLLLCALVVGGASSVWAADTYTFNSSIPTTGWSTSGGSQTINSKSWTYSSCTYIGAQATRIQIGSQKKPQTSAWTIQTAVSNFGSGKKITSIAITAYTTATTATYDISAGGTSVKSGSLTTSSATYTASSLNVTSGNIVITLTGSSTSKAMYLSNISVTYENDESTTYTVTYNGNEATSGTAPTDATAYSSGATVTVLGNTGSLVKTGYSFDGWNTKADGSGTDRAVGSTFSITANTTLYAKWTDSRTATTVDIDDSGIENTNKYVSTDAGSLSAAVTYGSSSAVPEASVTWSSSDESVATIHSTTGAVTLVGAGTTTITASYAGNATYQPSSDTYELTVTNEDPSYVTIWNEDFSTYSANDVPDGGTYGYFCVDGNSDTKIYENATAGGTSPELLINKKGSTNGSFSATIPLNNGYSGTLKLLFKNNQPIYVSVTDNNDNVLKASTSISANTTTGNTVEITGVTAEMTSVTILWSNSTDNNVRIDDIVLKGKEAPAKPTFSEAAKIFSSSFDTTISSAEGTTLKYTTDGTNPAESGTATAVASNSKTITISGTADVTVKAIAIKNEIISAVASVTYTYDARTAPTFTLSTTEKTIYNLSDDQTISLTTNSDGAVTFESSDDSKLDVDNTVDPTIGVLSASEAGDYTITVRTAATVNYLAAEGTVTVHVIKKPTTMVIDTDFSEGKDLRYGDEGLIEGKVQYNSVDLSPQPTITYTSSNTSVATVNSDGEISFVKAGTTTLTASYDGDDEYAPCEATYILELIDTTPQEIEVSPSFNNTFFGISAITSWKTGDPTSATGEKNNVSITYAKGSSSYFYCNASQIRCYDGNSLSFTAPTGYYITSIKFTSSTWNTATPSVGEMSSSDTKLWEGDNNTVSFSWSSTTRIESATVTLAPRVTVSSAGYATYASDHHLDFTGKTIKAYIATTKGDGSGVDFTQVYKVPAGTGVLLYKDGGTTESIPVFDGTGADATTGNKFVRGEGETVATDDGTNYNYILNNGASGIGFYRANDKMVATNRAYISILKSESEVKGFIALPGSEETAVEAVKADAENGVIFNLAGQRIQKLQRGINIINGKKVVVK